MRSLIVLAAALLPVLGAQAQDKSAIVDFALKKDQVEKSQRLNARYDAQVRAGFAGDEKLVAAMQADLKTIDALKDPTAKTAAIAVYQRKYTKAYRAALAKGKVDLAAWAAELNAITGRRYTVKDGTHLVATTSNAGNDQPAPATGTTVWLRDADFTFERDVGCGAIGGGRVTRFPLRFKAESWAAQAGGCSSDGTLYHDFIVPSDKQAQVDMAAVMSVKVWAVGVVGSASSDGFTKMTVSAMPSGQEVVYANLIRCAAYAPLFWAAFESCEDFGALLSIRVFSGRYRVLALATTSAWAFGNSAATSAEAFLNLSSVKITMEPR